MKSRPALLLCALLLFVLHTPALAAVVEPHGYITEYRLAEENLKPWALAFDHTGHLWITLDTTREIGRLDPQSATLTRYATPDALPYHLAVRDGQVWYTDFDLAVKGRPGRILRLDPATGQSTAYPLPDPNGGPAVLQFGPDGMLWVSEMSAGRLNRLDPQTGAFGGGWSPPPDDKVDRQRFPFGFSFDAQGRIWLAEAGTNRVLRIGPGENWKAYPMPDGFWGPSATLPGPDGQVWIPGHGTSAVAALDPATGTATLWPVQPPADGFPVARPSDLRFGAGGDLWVIEHEGGRLARIRPKDRTVVEYVLPRKDSQAEWIDLDREGNVWYAARGTGRVGRVSADAPYYSVAATLPETRLAPGGQLTGTLRVTPHGPAPLEYEFELSHAPPGVSAVFGPDGAFTLTADPRRARHGEYRVLLGVRTPAILAATPVTITVRRAGAGMLWVALAGGAAVGGIGAWFALRRK